MTPAFGHHPVLLAETLARLAPGPGSLVVDATVGGGGHAAAILERGAPDGRLIGLDVDTEALEAAQRVLARFGQRARLVRASYRELATILEDLGVARVDGVLMDLGVSSRQIDAPERGFRFAADTAERTPLDMRMDTRLPHTAADLLERASAAQLEDWLRRYGEVRGAGRLARAIVEARREAPLRTSADLLRVIRAARIGGGRRHDPATLVFQALRIAVNDELEALETGLEAAIEALAPSGRLVVIAYHSLEDRIVKNTIRDAVRGCVCPPEVPRCVCGRTPRLRALVRRPVRPTEAETRENPRARSARLRAAERL